MPHIPYNVRHILRFLKESAGLDCSDREPHIRKGFWIGEGKDKIYVSAADLAQLKQPKKTKAKQPKKEPDSELNLDADAS